MKNHRQRQLARIAYLYYIKGNSQDAIAQELGLNRTTISRMLARARQEGIVKFRIEAYDTELFQLENDVKTKYGLKSIEIVATTPDDEGLQQEIAQTAADLISQLLPQQHRVGISWGTTLSQTVQALAPKRLSALHFYPLAGGPKRISRLYHVNTLVYEMARKYGGTPSFINAVMIQASQEAAAAIHHSKDFAQLKKSWKELDLAIVGIGGKMKDSSIAWSDMFTKEEVQMIADKQAVGEVCGHFLNGQGEEIYGQWNKKTIAISLEDLKKVKDSVAVAYGPSKAAAILAVLRQSYINHLVTDEATIRKLLSLDHDEKFKRES